MPIHVTRKRTTAWDMGSSSMAQRLATARLTKPTTMKMKTFRGTVTMGAEAKGYCKAKNFTRRRVNAKGGQGREKSLGRGGLRRGGCWDRISVAMGFFDGK